MKLRIVTLFLLTLTFAKAQVKIDGYAFESGNRGYLNQVQIDVINLNTKQLVATVFSDMDGHFIAELPTSGMYNVVASKELFHTKELEVEVGSKTTFIKMEMKRAPGYIFEITLANKRDDDNLVVDAIKGALIEVYNNTTKKEVLVLKDHPEPDFQVKLNKGNHYTILIRKEGYLAKRMEAFVDVEGCILCFEGIGQLQPGVSDNLTEGNEMGTLLANVELDRLFQGKKMTIENIYYDFNKANIRPDAAVELDKVITFLKDNPRLTVQLGSHTDARGKENQNMKLSERRAKSAANYLINQGNLDKSRIYYKGFGESQIINRCQNGVDCTDEEHEENRRTELEIINIADEDVFKSLAQMKKDEQMEALILELTNQEIVEVPVKEIKEESKNLEATKNEKEKMDEEPFFEDNNVSEETVIENSNVTEDIMFEDHDVLEETVIESKNRVESVDVEEAKFEKMVSQTIEESEIKKNELLNGHKIVIHFTNIPLQETHEIFKKHNDVSTFITKNKNILYLVGQFETKIEANAYLEGIIKKDYPNAYVASFENGKRIRD